MNVPMLWANPFRLKLLREKNRRENLLHKQEKEPLKKQDSTKLRAFEMLYKSFALGRMF